MIEHTEETQVKLGMITGFAISGVVSMLFVVVATIGGELYTPLKDWLAATFSHHWIGKGVIAGVIFVFLGGLLGLLLREREAVSGSLVLAAWVAVVASLAISGFYVYEFFAHL